MSLPDEDVEFLDSYAESTGISTRSAAIHRAIRLLKATSLGPAYEAAWLEWEAAGESETWELALSDGLS